MSISIVSKIFGAAACVGVPSCVHPYPDLRITGGRKAGDRLNCQRTRSYEDGQAGQETRG